MSKETMISVVDDDAFVRDATADLIVSLGYDVRTFPSAETFLASGNLESTDCLITDLQMSGLNGLELQDHLLSAGWRTPVIFITAFPREEARTCALRAGAVAFLTKPFDASVLKQSIEHALNNCKSKHVLS